MDVIAGEPAASTKRRTYISLGKGNRVDWAYTCSALSFFVAAVLFAIGHHLYYESLDGRLAQSDNVNVTDTTITSTEKQVWALRIGNGLSFLYKTCIVSFLSMVGAQQVWATLRRKAMTIDGIDSMFLVMNSPRSLFNRNMLANAKVLVLLAIVSWLTPLVVVVAPPSLSVEPRLKASLVTLDVPTFNFSDTSRWFTTSGPGYVYGPSLSLGSLFTRMFSSAAYVSMAAPYPNVSYEQMLYGPSYKCVSLNDVLASDDQPTWPDEKNFTTFEDLFYSELGLPRQSDPINQSIIYTSAAPEYLNNMILISTGGQNPLWDGGTRPADLSNATSDTSDAGNNTAPDPPEGSSFVCQLYNTSFHLRWNFDEGVQNVDPLSIDFLEPQNWDYDSGQNAALSNPDAAVSGNSSVATVSMFVTHLLFSYLLVDRVKESVSGEVTFDGQTTVPLVQSPLIHCADFYNSTQFLDSDLGMLTFEPTPQLCRNGTLAAAIEDMSRNFTYSLLTLAAWSNYSETVVATTMESRIFFTYDCSVLWAAYSVSIATGLVALAIGAYALRANGVVGGVSFMTALQTTRNPQLDDLVRQSKEGTSLLDNDNNSGRQDLGKVRLRFGHINLPWQDGQTKHTGFGLDGTVDPL